MVNTLKYLIALLLTISLSAQPYVGTFEELPNTQMNSVDPCPARNCSYSGGGGVSGVMNAWGGGVYGGGKLYVWGGGHNDYLGNEVYAFDVASKSWSRVSEPKISNPYARHTYNHLQWLPNTNEFFTPQGYALSSLAGQTGNANVWTFSEANGFTPKGVSPYTSIGGGGYTAYVPARNEVLYHNEYGSQVVMYDPVTNTHKQIGSKAITQYMVAATDTRRNHVLAIGGKSTFPQAYLWNMTPDIPTYTSVKSHISNRLATDGQIGFDYDPVNDVFVAWDGGTTFFTVDPVTFSTETHTATGANPGSPNRNGTYGRFRYMPDHQKFVLVNEVDKNVFLFTLSGEGGTPPPVDPPIDPPSPITGDWPTRSTAAGVVRAFGFDTEAEVTNWIHLDSTQSRVSHEKQIVASGTGALRFDILKTDGAASGSWRTWLRNDEKPFVRGDTFYVSFRQYFPEAFVRTRFSEQGGWKQIIVSRRAGDMNGANYVGTVTGSNQINEIVMNNYLYRGYPQGYNRIPNGSYVGWQDNINTACNRYDFVYQNQRSRTTRLGDTPCETARASNGGLYSYKGPHPDPLTNAWLYPVNGWATFKLKISLGSNLPNELNSNIQLYAAHDGEDWSLLIDKNVNLTEAPEHDGFWLLPYDTNKRADSNRPDTFTVYDDVIVSTQDIAAPGQTIVVPPVDPPVDPINCPPPTPCPIPAPCPVQYCDNTEAIRALQKIQLELNKAIELIRN